MGGGNKSRGGDDGEAITKSGFKAPLAFPHGDRGGGGLFLSFIIHMDGSLLLGKLSK